MHEQSSIETEKKAVNQTIEDQLARLIVEAQQARDRVQAKATNVNAHLARQSALEMNNAVVALEKALRAYRDLEKHLAIARGR